MATRRASLEDRLRTAYIQRGNARGKVDVLTSRLVWARGLTAERLERMRAAQEKKVSYYQARIDSLEAKLTRLR